MYYVNLWKFGTGGVTTCTWLLFARGVLRQSHPYLPEHVCCILIFGISSTDIDSADGEAQAAEVVRVGAQASGGRGEGEQGAGHREPEAAEDGGDAQGETRPGTVRL